MFRYLLTVCIVVLLAKEAFSASTVDISTVESTTVDMATNTGTGLMASATPGTGTGSGVVNTAKTPANTATKNAGTAGGNTTPKNSQNGTTPAATGSTTVNTVSSTLQPFQCYQGNCSGADCHQSKNITSILSTVECKTNECSMKVTTNSTWSFAEFDCNIGECICRKKVTGHWKTCCTTAKCNVNTPGCSHSSNLAASLVVLAISFVSLYLLN